MPPSRTAVTYAAACFLMAACGGSKSAPLDPGKDPAFRAFLDNVQEYERIHDAAAKDLPELTTTRHPEEIRAYTRKLAGAIRAARSGAKRGHVFSASEPQIVQVVRTELRGDAGDTAKRAILKENPESKVVVRVNGDYPTDAPRTTVPPALLVRLPTLPKYLEYRFVGTDLILLDNSANLIVDYIENVIT